MEMDLYQNNIAAYGAAMEKIKECGRAAVIQPTGTDKLALIWTLLEEHPGEKIVWLVPGAYALRLRQVECAAKALAAPHTPDRRSPSGTNVPLAPAGGGENGLPENVTLYSCEELAAADPRKWVELGESRPAWLIVDGYHAIAADLWNRSVARLIGLCPDIRVLGLGEMGVKPSPCLRAQELFGEDAVAACCSVNEAAAAGAMPVPPELVALLWSSRDVMRGLKARVKNLHSPGLPDPLMQLYNNLDYAVRDAEEAAKEPVASMAEQGGRFYVLAEDQEWLRHCLPELSVRLSHEGAAPRVYTVARDSSLVDSPARAEFEADAAPGVRLLAYWNEPDAMLPQEGIDGAILLHKSSDPRIARLMVNRVMAACGGVPLVDYTDSFEGVITVLDARRSYEKAVKQQGGIPIAFRQRDPLRQSVICFRQLKKALEQRWNAYYEAAKACAGVELNLEFPSNYVTPEGLAVGRWLEIQRKVRAGKRPGRLTEEQIAKLDKIGVVWKQRLTLAWEKGWESAKKYRDTHGDLMVPVRYRDKNGFALGEWIVYNRQRYFSHSLDPQRVERLSELGMVWDTMSQLWEQSYAAAARYYLEHGDLEVPVKYITPEGMALGVWLGSQRTAYKNHALSEDQIARMNAIGVDWTNRNDRKWQQAYDAAVEYRKIHGNLNVPSEYVTADGLMLGKWIARQRYACQRPDHSSTRLTPERKALLDKLGMVWSRSNGWDYRLSLAREYKQAHHGAPVPSQYITEEGIWLGSWISRQKQRVKKNDPTLTAAQSAALEELFHTEMAQAAARVRRPRGVQRDLNWQRNYRRAKAYYKKYGDLLVPASYIDETGFRLGVWISNLRAARKTRPNSSQVSAEHIALLDEIGMEWDAREAKWECAYQQVKRYAEEKGTLLVPVNYKTPEGFCLGDWVRRARECYAAQDPRLTPEQIAKLDAIGMVWEQDLRKGTR